LQHRFSRSFFNDDQQTNIKTLPKKVINNISFDYSVTKNNTHVFGEIAASGFKNLAVLNGALASLSKYIDVSMLYRNINRGFISFESNAFTENITPINETGLFSGASININDFLQFNIGLDVYKFHWLQNGNKAPFNGIDMFLQTSYKPNKKTELLFQFKSSKKDKNSDLLNSTTKPITNEMRKSVRIQYTLKFNSKITIKNRIEFVDVEESKIIKGNGAMLYFDFLYNPLMKPFSASFRIYFFDVKDYNSRIYCFENDVIGSSEMPVFYDNGIRFYCNLKYKLLKHFVFSLKCGELLFRNKYKIGSGNDAVQGNKKTEIKGQIIYNF
jgi:hypothetical protein